MFRNPKARVFLSSFSLVLTSLLAFPRPSVPILESDMAIWG